MDNVLRKKFQRAAIVLGAGASKGALLRPDLTPPLDADFLRTASHLARYARKTGPRKNLVSAWSRFRQELKGARLKIDDVVDWRLEQLSTFLEARSNLQGLQLHQGRPRDFAEALTSLKGLICNVLQSTGGTLPCSLHHALFKAIQPRAVVTFNYDLIADQTLMHMRRLNWSLEEYRGARVAAVEGGDGTYFRQVPRLRIKDKVRLIKLHGSINYEEMRRGGGYRLSGMPLPGKDAHQFDFRSVSNRPYLIPPVAAKMEIRDGVLRERWRHAVDVLHDARCWIIWGYSFPATDTISQVLFRASLERNRKKKPVLVINPDSTAATRVEQVCQKVTVAHIPSAERALYMLGAEIERVE